MKVKPFEKHVYDNEAIIIGKYKTGLYTAATVVAALVWSPPRVKTDECKDDRLYLARLTEQGHRQGTWVLLSPLSLLFV